MRELSGQNHIKTFLLSFSSTCGLSSDLESVTGQANFNHGVVSNLGDNWRIYHAFRSTSPCPVCLEWVGVSCSPSQVGHAGQNTLVSRVQWYLAVQTLSRHSRGGHRCGQTIEHGRANGLRIVKISHGEPNTANSHQLVQILVNELPVVCLCSKTLVYGWQKRWQLGSNFVSPTLRGLLH